MRPTYQILQRTVMPAVMIITTLVMPLDSNAASSSIFAKALNRAESRATPQGKKVLQQGRAMIEREEPGVKGCWDYIDDVYSQAGFPAQSRITKFKSRKKGPYADLKQIKPGDWLYYVNQSYGNIEHSAIFVDWVDAKTNQALMLSYAGENREEAARYKTYDISQVYRITRPGQTLNLTVK